MKIRYLMTKDFAESMQLVANKRADAFILDDVLLAGQISNLPNASEFTILDASLGVNLTAPCSVRMMLRSSCGRQDR